MQKAFSGPLELKRRLGHLDPARIAATDAGRPGRGVPRHGRPSTASLDRWPSGCRRCARRSPRLRRRRRPGVDRGRHRAPTCEATRRPAGHRRHEGALADRGRSSSARGPAARLRGGAPDHPTLGDVDSAEALAAYQAAKRADKRRCGPPSRDRRESMHPGWLSNSYLVGDTGGTGVLIDAGAPDATDRAAADTLTCRTCSSPTPTPTTSPRPTCTRPLRPPGAGTPARGRAHGPSRRPAGRRRRRTHRRTAYRCALHTRPQPRAPVFLINYRVTVSPPTYCSRAPSVRPCTTRTPSSTRSVMDVLLAPPTTPSFIRGTWTRPRSAPNGSPNPFIRIWRGIDASRRGPLHRCPPATHWCCSDPTMTADIRLVVAGTIPGRTTLSPEAAL